MKILFQGLALALAVLGAGQAAAQATDLVCNQCVGTTDIAVGAVVGDRLADNAVRTAKIQNGAVTGPKRAPDAVTGANIVDRSIGTVDIAVGAVTGGRLADNAVRSSKIQDGAVIGAKVADGAIGPEKLSDEARAGLGPIAPVSWAVEIRYPVDGDFDLSTRFLGFGVETVLNLGGETPTALPTPSAVSLAIELDPLIPILNFNAAHGAVFDSILITNNAGTEVELLRPFFTQLSYRSPRVASDPYLVDAMLALSNTQFEADLPFEFIHAGQLIGPCGLTELIFGKASPLGPLPPGEIPIRRFEAALIVPAQSAGGGTLEPGPPTLPDIKVIGPLPDEAACLLGLVFDGNPLDRVQINAYSDKTEKTPETEIHLDPVLFTNLQVTTTATGTLEESVSFYYERIRWVHRKFDDKGGVVDEVERTYDLNTGGSS